MDRLHIHSLDDWEPCEGWDYISDQPCLRRSRPFIAGGLNVTRSYAFCPRHQVYSLRGKWHKDTYLTDCNITLKGCEIAL